jgi:hypothetical protein
VKIAVPVWDADLQQWVLLNLEEWIDYASIMIETPKLTSGMEGSPEIFIAINLQEWVDGGMPPKLPEYQIVNGVSPDLPGYLIGTTPITFDPSNPEGPFWTEPYDGVVYNHGVIDFHPAYAPPPQLDIKPGSCPNSFNRNSHGMLPVALVGTDSFDVSQVDLDSLLLVRTDGVGGSVAPNFGPPGPHPTIDDVATPFEGEECDCHEATGDGIDDLMLHFRTDDVVANLDLNSFPPGAFVSLTLTGTLEGSEAMVTAGIASQSFSRLSGRLPPPCALGSKAECLRQAWKSDGGGEEFAVADCVRLVPPGTPPGLLAVTSNLPGAWIDLTPPDDAIDQGGFANFVRSYPLTTEVTLTAPSAQLGWVFVGWNVIDLGFSSNDRVADNFDTLIRRQSITLPIEDALEVVEAVYQQVMLP